MKKEFAKIQIIPDVYDSIHHYLTNIPTCKEECFDEDSKYSFTAKFNDGMQMDVEICGVQYDEDETDNNLAWTQAVLFKGPCEVACSDVEDTLLGTWELEYNDTKYICNVEIANVEDE